MIRKTQTDRKIYERHEQLSNFTLKTHITIYISALYKLLICEQLNEQLSNSRFVNI